MIMTRWQTNKKPKPTRAFFCHHRCRRRRIWNWIRKLHCPILINSNARLEARYKISVHAVFFLYAFCGLYYMLVCFFFSRIFFRYIFTDNLYVVSKDASIIFRFATNSTSSRSRRSGLAGTYILDKCLKSLGYACRVLDILCAIFRRVYLCKIHELIRMLLLQPASGTQAYHRSNSNSGCISSRNSNNDNDNDGSGSSNRLKEQRQQKWENERAATTYPYSTEIFWSTPTLCWIIAAATFSHYVCNQTNSE